MSNSPIKSNEEIENRVCPNCNSSNVDRDLEKVRAICNGCGLVIRSFEANPSVSREADSPDEPTDNDEPLTWSDACTVRNSTEQRVAEAFVILEAVSESLRVSDDVCREAAALFSSAAKQNLTDGRPTEVTIAATVHVAGIATAEPRPLARIADALDVEKSRVGHVARVLRRELDHKYAGTATNAYLPFLRVELGFPPEVAERAERLLAEAESAKITNGRSPAGIAGAALYCTSDGGRSQREVASAAGVSKETIRVRVKDLRILAEKSTEMEAE